VGRIGEAPASLALVQTRVAQLIPLVTHDGHVGLLVLLENHREHWFLPVL